MTRPHHPHSPLTGSTKKHPAKHRATKAERFAMHLAHLEERSEREIKSLSPTFAEKITKLLDHLKTKGWKPVVYHGTRTKAQQAEKIRQGHSSTMKSFHVSSTYFNYPDKIYNMREMGDFYVKGEAADIVDARWLWSGPASNLMHPFWKDLGDFAKALELEWGGDWKGKRRTKGGRLVDKKDVAHVQWKFIVDTSRPEESAQYLSENRQG